MPFSHKDWKDDPDSSTPLSAAALENLEDRVTGYADGIVAAHTGATSAAHAASAVSFTPTGTIAASDVQAAVAEVATDAASALASGLAGKANTSHTHPVADLGSGTPASGKYLDGAGAWTTLPSGGSASYPTVIDIGGNLGASKTIATGGANVVARNGTLNTNCAITLTGLPAGSARTALIVGAQDATGSRTVTVNDGSGAQSVAIPSTALAPFLIVCEWDGTDTTAYSAGDTSPGLAEHLADTSAAHAASAISFTPTGTVAATTVQAAIAEVASEAGSGGTAAGTSFTPTGTIAATNVQAAIAEVASEASGGGASAMHPARVVGMKTWTWDPILHTGPVTGSGGVLLTTAILVPEAMTVTQLSVIVSTAGSGLSTAVGGLYSSAGTLIAKTASQASAWTSTGRYDMTLTAESGQSLTLTAGIYICGVNGDGSGAPGFSSRETSSSDIANYGTTGPALRSAYLFPATGAPATISGMTAASKSPWFGLN